MVCSIICAPAITLLAWLSDKLGLSGGVTGIFIGALVVWVSELQSNFLFKLRDKLKLKGKIKGDRFGHGQLIPFQTAIITIINLILFAFLVSELNLF